MGLMLTGRRVTAREGYDFGFVNDVVPAGEAPAAARRRAAEIMECSPMSVRATKEAALRGLAAPTEAGIVEEWEYPAMKRMLASADAVEGPAAFAQKRRPAWKGC